MAIYDPNNNQHSDGRDSENKLRMEEKKPWSFVAKYYPNYSSDDEILRNDDLTKLCENEYEEGDGAHTLLVEDYNNDITNPAILADKLDSDRYCYEAAIDNFNNIAKPIADYAFFVFCKLVEVIKPNMFPADLEYDYMFEGLTSYYKNYLDSKYIIQNKGEYECMVEFLNNSLPLKIDLN